MFLSQRDEQSSRYDTWKKKRILNEKSKPSPYPNDHRIPHTKHTNEVRTCHQVSVTMPLIFPNLWRSQVIQVFGYRVEEHKSFCWEKHRDLHFVSPRRDILKNLTSWIEKPDVIYWQTWRHSYIDVIHWCHVPTTPAIAVPSNPQFTHSFHLQR